MPYNPSTGVYQLPAIYLAVPGTVIIAAQHNTPLTDLQTAQNYPRPIIAGGTGQDTIAGTVSAFSLVQYEPQVLDDAQMLQTRQNIGAATAAEYEVKTANYTVLVEDLNKTINVTTSATVFFDAVADLGANFTCEIWSNTGVTVRIRPDGSELINGAANLVISDGERATVWCDGTALIANVTSDALTGPQAQGAVYGLGLSTNALDPTNDVDIAAGFAAADASPFNIMQLGSALGKRVDAAWSSGGTPASPNGGLDTGSVGNNTYYIFAIQRPDTNNVDALLSLSSTAPTMPSNYTRKRLLGFFTRAGGVNGPITWLTTQAVGVGQTWVDVAASRAVNTPYQNTTGRPIYVNVSLLAAAAGRTLDASPNGSTWVPVGAYFNGSNVSASAVIQSTWFYRINGTGTIVNWAELR